MEKLIYRIEHYDNVGSTNTLLKSRAKHGENEGLVIWADSQSEGRGRLGRSFYSPDSGLFLLQKRFILQLRQRLPYVGQFKKQPGYRRI